MMDNNLPIDPAAPAVFLPPGEADKPEAQRIVYRFRLPSVADRLKLRRAVAALGGNRHGERDLMDELREGLAALLGADSAEAAAALAVIARYESLRDGFFARVRAGGFADNDEGRAERAAAAAEMAAALKATRALETVVGQGWPAYADMLADNSVYGQIVGLAALRVLCIGWDNLAAPWRHGPAGLPEECLAAVPEWHLPFIADFVEGLLEPRGAQAKN